MAIDRRAIPAAATEGTWSAPDGHVIRRIDWKQTDANSRGSILYMPGRGDFYEKYLESLNEWHLDGWNVTAADWRGQAGSGRLGKDPFTGHIDDFTTWTADLQAFWADWTEQTAGPHILAAHSMGGHVVMRALADNVITPLPDAVFLSAPMMGMAGPPLPLSVLHHVAKLMTRMGDPMRPAWKGGEKPGDVPEERIKLLTHDDQRYADELWWRINRPEIAMGPASWGWLECAYDSWRRLEEEGALEAISVPVLICSTPNDKLVSHAANVKAVERLPHGEMMAFGDEARHEILREVDTVRGQMMRGIADFLNRVAPGSNAGKG
ncbi:MAG: alpha/beta hydrolase [Pseudomonadota bacterium]